MYLWPDSHPIERVKYMKAEIELSLRRASAIITDTEFTRHEVAKFFGWPLHKIYTVPLACSQDFRPYAKSEIQKNIASLGLDFKKYTLSIGTIEPRKNLTTLITAYSRLPDNLKLTIPLVLAGYSGWKNEALYLQIEGARREGWLKYLGYIPDTMLPMVYAGSLLFAFPSLYEGFGLPVLEAMASGVPVICSNASTLPEVAGDAALFHAPQDVEHLTEMLRKGLEDDEWRMGAMTRGLTRALNFSWERCTSDTLAVYRAVSGA